jgi:hypothetical protein
MGVPNCVPMLGNILEQVLSRVVRRCIVVSTASSSVGLGGIAQRGIPDRRGLMYVCRGGTI